MFDWLVSILGHELFGTTISVLELVISALGLFVGGYAGTRQGALERMRVDDRRSLLDAQLPELMGVVRGGHPSPVELVRLVGVVENVVELLPWLDRQIWSQFAAGLPLNDAERVIAASDRNRQARAALNFDPNIAVTAIGDPPPDFGERNRLAAAASQRQRETAQAVKVATEEFEAAMDVVAAANGESQLFRHLRYRLRPGVWRRLRLSMQAVGLAVRMVWRSIRKLS